MAGYSKIPLWKKLGIKEKYCCFLFQAPENYFDLLEATPLETSWNDVLNNSLYDFIHVFVTELTTLKKGGADWKTVLKKMENYGFPGQREPQKWKPT